MIPHPKKFASLSILSLSLVLVALGSARGEEPKGKPKFTNKLAAESSPYLLQHAHNPVNWYPWGEEAFAKAKKEGKFIFLSIGYSSCHWCHVMEKESFSNEKVAKILNDKFVCIKVDREERPDVDNIYMTALSVMGIRGGWPLSMFMTAEGKPIFGGTYWPREDKKLDDVTLRGFITILETFLKITKENPKEIAKQADAVAEATARALEGGVPGIALVELDRDLVEDGTEELEGRFDRVYGGFGFKSAGFRGPKFPTPTNLLLLQYEANRTKSKEFDKIVHETLDKMALGGIYDHLGGGFHRYSTERTWTVPHFEKMLYDNAQLLEAYANAYEKTKKPLYKRVLQETVEYLRREMTSPTGGLFSALDADSEGEEGRFYVWTKSELSEALKGVPNADLLRAIYGLDGEPNFEEKYYILRLEKPLAKHADERSLKLEQLLAKLAPVKKKLFDLRAKRERPFLDTKILTAWNGEIVAGLARAGQVLESKETIDSAKKAADFVLKTMKTKEGRLLRTYGAAPGAKPKAKLNGYLDDYAYLVHGLLTLHDVTKEERWLNEAKALTATMTKWHHDEKRGGFYFTSHDHEKFFARSKDQYDGAQPSGNSMAVRNFVRLWQKTEAESYRDMSKKTFRHFAGAMKASPISLTTMLEALSMYLDSPPKEKK